MDSFVLDDLYIKPEARDWGRYKILQEFFSGQPDDKYSDIETVLEIGWGNTNEMLQFLLNVGFKVYHTSNNKIHLHMDMDKFLEKLWL
jgi:hypothetical protein